MKFWCKNFVSLDSLDVVSRRDAAVWALDKFGTISVDIFRNNDEGVPGFWFEKEHDALMFALKWSGL